jgi:hypothetical protein
MHLGSLFDCSPAVNFASRDAAGPNVQWGPRLIPDWQFFHVVSGEAVLQLGRSRWRMRVVRTGQRLSARNDEGNRILQRSFRVPQ